MAGTASQGQNAVAIGLAAGNTGQGSYAVAIGSGAGNASQGSNAIAIGLSAGNASQGSNAVAIGAGAGQTNQGSNAVAIGTSTGQTGQGQYAVAIGSEAGNRSQGENSVAIGSEAGNYYQKDRAVAIGAGAGQTTQQQGAVAMGYLSGNTGQGANAVAIGPAAGQTNQGSNAVAIGNRAGEFSQYPNSIILNASGVALNTTDSGLYASPLRSNAVSTQSGMLFYNTGTSEIQYIESSKTFVIDHPVDPDRYLVHACLEGPEAGVYYRGESKIDQASVVVRLPEYVESLARDFTVHVTPIGEPRLLGTSRVTGGQFTVYGPPGEFFWVVYGKRGSIEVEPMKKEVRLSGEGPYKWITSS